MSEDDKFVKPEHYYRLGDYAAIYVIQKWKLGFNLGNAVKYIQRAGTKPEEPEIRDLKKAIFYIQRHIHELDSSEADPAI